MFDEHPHSFNKYRAAIDVLHRGRDVLVANLADEILDRQDDLSEGGFLLNEFLEASGSRLHFLCLLIGQLEQSAELLEEARPSAPPPPEPAPPRPSASEPAAEPDPPRSATKPAAKRRPRAKKLSQPATDNHSADEN